jgi:LDH2 family malate/lactate/ureidoglycolate dehydrogenase
MSAKTIVAEQKLRAFSTKVLTSAGMGSPHAEIAADSLLFSDLRGVGSHGVARLSSYMDRVHAGVMKIDPPMEIVRNFDASALLDAANGFGQIAGVKAMDIAIDKARQRGVGVVGVCNSNHFGVAAYFAAQAVAASMIGLVFTNASPAMTPHNARTPLVGTNPLAVGIPAGEQKPILLDMSTSLVARGKIRLASLTGEKIPLGWAVDQDGKPTDDPLAALKGSLAPIGGPKGAGLSLVIDLLCGVLTGTALTGEVRNITDVSGPSLTGHIFMALDISKFIGESTFLANVDHVIENIKGLPSADGGPIYLPGEIESNLATLRQAEGIPLARDVVDELARLGERYGVPLIG